MKRSMAGVVAVAIALVACSGGNSSVDTVAPTSAAPSSLPPVTTIAVTSTAPVDTTTVPASASTTVVPDGVARLSDDGPWRLVDSAPGVTTPGLVYELMPKLWAFLPTEESDTDGNLYVPHPDDIPIIEAYLRAVLVYYQSTTQRPMDLDAPGWAESFSDGGAAFRMRLEPLRDQGQYVDLDAGTVLRPRVLGEGREESSAIIFDCILDGSVFRAADGTLAAGSTPGVAPLGVGAKLSQRSAQWFVDTMPAQPEACL